jgi:quercetin 2,3-dioxygenase
MSTSFLTGDSRGTTSIDWLDSRHSFSFAHYVDRERMNFSVLRVLNDDRIEPGTGFGRHPHADMEIITYVLEGGLRHEDSAGNAEILPAGGVQRMSAGTGVFHSEINASQSEPCHFLQVWLIPEREGIAPGYEQLETTPEQRLNRLLPVVGRGGEDDGAAARLAIHQDVTFLLGRIEPEVGVSHALEPGRSAYLFVASGEIEAAGKTLAAGDALEYTGEAEVAVQGRETAEIVLFDLPG